MATLDYILGDVITVLFVLLALLAARQWHRKPNATMGWITLTLGSLAAITLLPLLIGPEEGIIVRPALDSFTNDVLVHIELALLTLFPWFMYRFTGAFAARRKRIGLALDLLTLAVLAAGLVIPFDTAERDPVPGWYMIYIFAIVAQWVLLLGATSLRLWRAGRGQPTIARRRMMLLASGAIGMAGAFVLIGASSGEGEQSATISIITQLIAIGSAITFYTGFFTPKILRVLWRTPEQETMREGIAELLTITDAEQLKEQLLPQMAQLVSARGIAFVDKNGQIIALYGVSDEDAQEAAQRFATAESRENKRAILAAGRAANDNPILPMDFDFGTLLIWINPYMPFFGPEEFELMRSLGVIFSLALDRTQALASQTQIAVQESERAEAESERAQQLEQVSKLKDEFVAMASHELRTPLASILGFSQTLKDMPERFTPEQQATFLSIIHEQGIRLQRLIEDMLTLSRIESGGLKVELQPVNVRDAIHRAIMAISATQVEVLCDNELYVQADPHHLHQILVNYLTNAQRYGKAPFYMRGQAEQNTVRITVEDEGEGVPVEFVPRMFKRFSQASQSGKVGTGLGLSIVKEMAQAQGGDAWYQPREGGGSSFGVTMPAAKGPAATAAPDQEAGPDKALTH